MTATAELKIRYDVPFEVTKKQLEALRVECSGFIAYRIDDQNKCWVKVLMMNEVGYVKQILKENA